MSQMNGINITIDENANDVNLLKQIVQCELLKYLTIDMYMQMNLTMLRQIGIESS